MTKHVAGSNRASLLHKVALLIAFAIVPLVYWNGLSGPFLFDDHIHITQNQWVKIDSFGWQDLSQAWNSSFSSFPSNRPLAQLTFGINHAMSGLDPRSFKLTNLMIHLIMGVFVFLLARLAMRAATGSSTSDCAITWIALATATVWLIHPLHTSTVLYPVQRMTQISSLAMLVALVSYFHGRIQLSIGNRGTGWMLLSAPVAAAGFLGKENAALLPLLLLVSELTVLGCLRIANRSTGMRWVWALYIALPLLVGAVHLLTHPQLLNYEGRPFTLTERILTEPRVLWIYVRQLLVPDITQMGLFHDDLPVSRSLTQPATTIVAILAWAGVLIAAMVYRKRYPLFSFAVLFFLANHALESTIFPLELMFEHRNYLASVGLFLLIAHMVVASAKEYSVQRLAMTLGTVLIGLFAFLTFLRADNWSSYQRFIVNAAQHHPDSPRTNFMAGQFLISAIAKTDGPTDQLEKDARSFLRAGLRTDPGCLNCLFGLIVLDLYLDRYPEKDTLQQLAKGLRHGDVGPTKVSVSQFGYLVKWHQSDDAKMSPADMQAIFDAALANPRWNGTGRASIATNYANYYDKVLDQPDAALPYAEQARQIWPEPWKLHMNVVELLRKLGRHEQALATLSDALAHANNADQQQQTAIVERQIRHEMNTTESHGQ